jgi:hypothetical protein
VRDDIIRVTVTDGIHTFTRAVTVHVNDLGRTLQMGGIGDRVVYEDSTLVVDVEPYLYNVDDIADVQLSLSPMLYAVVDGFVVTFTFPTGIAPAQHQVTFTAREGEDMASETITITIEKRPLVFTFAPIGSVTVKEDEPYTLDVTPFLVNMDPTAEYVIADHSDHVEVNGFTLTFLYRDEFMTDEIVRVNVTGTNGDFAEQDVFVHVNLINDRPELVKPLQDNFNIIEGGPALVINLTDYFTDVDTSVLAFSCTSDKVTIDNDSGKATMRFELNTPKPDDVVGAKFTAYDPDDPTSKVESNAFDITYYLEGDDPGPGTGPDGPSLQTTGGTVGVIIALLIIAVAGGVGYLYYRKKHPKQGLIRM